MITSSSASNHHEIPGSNDSDTRLSRLSNNPFFDPGQDTSSASTSNATSGNDGSSQNAFKHSTTGQNVNTYNDNSGPSSTALQSEMDEAFSKIRLFDNDPSANEGRIDPSTSVSPPLPFRNNNHNHPSTPSPSSHTATRVQYPEPTKIPTPGRPLLRDGRILIMPPTWETCSKCDGTGYKHNDPDQPHESCWQSFGRKYTEELLSSVEVMNSAVILQTPLPFVRPAGFPPPPRRLVPDVQPAGSSSQARTFTSYAPPDHAPPSLHGHSQQPSGRHSPPQVNRANDASEANADPDGEAPPSYEDVVRVPHHTPLPPQRTGHPNEPGRPSLHQTNTSYQPPPHHPNSHPHHFHSQSQHGWTGPMSPSHQTGGYPGQGSFSHPHPAHGPGPYSQQFHHGPPIPGGFPGQTPWPHHYPQQSPWHGPGSPSSAFVVHSGNPNRPPPPGALIVQPGDPRIGGRVCVKCSGRGVRDSMLWGEETCRHCFGAGRVNF
ncbi:unnamed protein product [Sympodiomycopsis kandeliae]